MAILLSSDSKPSGGLSYHLASSQWIYWDEDPMAFAWEVRRYVQSIAPEDVARSAWDWQSCIIPCFLDSQSVPSSLPLDLSDESLQPITRKRSRPSDDRLPLSTGEEVGEYTIVSCLGTSDLSLSYLANRTGHPKKQVIIREMFPRGLAFREVTNGNLKWSNDTPAKRKSIRAIRKAYLREALLARNRSLSDLCLSQQIIQKKQTQYSIRSFICGQTLKNIVEAPDRNISATEVYDLFMLLLDQLIPLHGAGILHGDLNPANVVISELEGPKIIDYESHMKVGCRRDEHFPAIVSNGFTPPEGYIFDKDNQPNYQECFDLFSLGATIYFCLASKPPQIATIERDIETLIREDFIPWRLASAVGWCLATNFAQRPQSASELQLFLASGKSREAIRW